MARGRLGCWRGGCCTGRLTSGRWAWCGGLGTAFRGDEIPVQMMEAAGRRGFWPWAPWRSAGGRSVRPGAVLAGRDGGDALARQLLFRFRLVPRWRTSAGTSLASLVSGAALAAAWIVLVAAAQASAHASRDATSAHCCITLDVGPPRLLAGQREGRTLGTGGGPTDRSGPRRRPRRGRTGSTLVRSAVRERGDPVQSLDLDRIFIQEIPLLQCDGSDDVGLRKVARCRRASG